MKKTIYLIPGVGADETVFTNLTFPEDIEKVHIKWEKPKKREQLKDYVKRLLPQIKKDTLPIFVGLSFGGIVSIELSKLMPTHMVVLISSIKSHHERPYKMSLLNLLKLYRMFPAKLAVTFTFWHRWAFGHLTNVERELVNKMVENIDLEFNTWAVDQAIHWRNMDVPENLVHIHGDNDTIFPHIYIRDYYRIRGGTHFMIVNKAKEISEIIHEELEGRHGVIEKGIELLPKESPKKKVNGDKKTKTRFFKSRRKETKVEKK